MEVTSIFAGASILTLLIGGVLMLLWFGRLLKAWQVLRLSGKAPRK
jgi:hypothetical protein